MVPAAAISPVSKTSGPLLTGVGGSHAVFVKICVPLHGLSLVSISVLQGEILFVNLTVKENDATVTLGVTLVIL